MRIYAWLPVFLAATGLVLTACERTAPAPEVGFKVEKEKASAAPPPPEAVTQVAASKQAASGEFKTLRIYTDANSPDNRYAPSGWMGDYGDLQFSKDHFDNPRSGTTCIKIVYTAQATQGANWSGIYWQEPPNNWGARDGGLDLTGASRLVFWARGEKGGEIIEEFRVGGIPGEFADSDVVGIGPIKLTLEWKRYEIDLTDRDMSSIIGGFMWSANKENNPEGFTMYLDDIYYE